MEVIVDFLINKDNEIITKVLTHFNEDYLTHKYFNDGTQSRVILLNNKFLIKQNTEKAIKAEVEFLLLNKIDKFQKILYVDPTYQFAVYEFIEGDVMKSVDDIDDLISNIVFITTHYKFYNHDGFGYLGEEFNSWSEFLDSEVTYSSSNLSNYISDNRLVFNCIKDLEKFKFNKKLLHGDFGTHNFIKQNGKFGYVNVKGNIVIPVIYNSATDFKYGKAFVKLNNEAFYINKKGEKL